MWPELKWQKRPSYIPYTYVDISQQHPTPINPRIAVDGRRQTRAFSYILDLHTQRGFEIANLYANRHYCTNSFRWL